jgi:hypothetical protein
VEGVLATRLRVREEPVAPEVEVEPVDGTQDEGAEQRDEADEEEVAHWFR